MYYLQCEMHNVSTPEYKNNGDTDMPQFCGGNPYFLSENLYKSVSLIDASMLSRYCVDNKITILILS